jgi:hypothetical protein
MLITLLLFILSMTMFMILAVVSRKNLFTALKGPDNRWDIVDVVKAVWLILFPLGFLSNLYLRLSIQPEWLYSLDAIFLLLIVNDGRKSYIAYLGNKNKGKDDEKTPPPIDDLGSSELS